MINSSHNHKTDASLQSSLTEIEKKLSIIEIKLALQSVVTPSGTIEDDVLANEQKKLLDDQENLLNLACSIPISKTDRPETFLKLWRHNRETLGDLRATDMLAIKVEEHFTNS